MEVSKFPKNLVLKISSVQNDISEKLHAHLYLTVYNATVLLENFYQVLLYVISEHYFSENMNGIKDCQKNQKTKNEREKRLVFQLILPYDCTVIWKYQLKNQFFFSVISSSVIFLSVFNAVRVFVILVISKTTAIRSCERSEI